MIDWKAFPGVSLDHPLTDKLIQFAQKMECLVAFCLVFRRLEDGDTASDGDDHSPCSSSFSSNDNDVVDDYDDYVDPDNGVVYNIDQNVQDACDVEDDVHDSYDDVYDDEGDDKALMEQINHRMTSEVLPTRSALWFHSGSELPDATDVPLVHYQELIKTTPWKPPLKL